MVEELLQLLIGVVDAELFEAVQLEDLEAGNVENADEAGALPLGPVQGPVDPRHDPLEEALVGGLGDGLDGELDLLLGLGLGDVVAAHLDAGLEEGLRQVGHLDAQQVGHLAQANNRINEGKKLRTGFWILRSIGSNPGPELSVLVKTGCG